MKKIISMLLAAAMLVSATVSFAAAPSDYDGQSYDSLGYTSDDPDGMINLAVIANGDINIGNAMYIEGSVYSNGDIYVTEGQGNKIDGLLISGTGDTVFNSDENNNEWTQTRTAEGYIHVNSNGTTEGINYYSSQPEYEGAINDTETSFECDYEPFTVPDIAESLGIAEFNVYGNEYMRNMPITVTEDVRYDKVTMNGTNGPALTIDTANGDVTVVIDEIVQDSANINIKVVGENEAYIYIGKLPQGIPVIVNYNSAVWPMEQDGSAEHTHLYFGSDTTLGASKIAANEVEVNADYLEISGSTYLKLSKPDNALRTSAKEFVINGYATEIYAQVCAPNADSKVIDSGKLYGQLHTNTLTINGAGSIIWKADKAVTKPDTEPDPTPAPVPDGEEIDLNGVGYAYIFGYEPEISYEYDEIAGGHLVAKVRMAPQDAVTREQVAAMIMRLIDQKYDTKNETYPVTENMSQHSGTWYERGLAYLAGKGTFDGIASVETGAVTRGEVAKLVAYGLNLSKTVPTAFTDIENSLYKTYIEMMSAYGYMQGMSDTEFNPDKVMTRAEFCSMFNQVIGRENAKLESADGVQVTPDLYSIVDLDGHWAKEVMLRATSAYNSDGYVDVETRLNNIRNDLDKYDSQKWF